jgi:hypothetical protein
VVVVVVGADVVGVVLGTVCVDVDGTVVDVAVVPVFLVVALSPGCSSAMTRPTRAVAPAAATIVAAVRWRTSAVARRRASGEFSRLRLIEDGGSGSSAYVNQRGWGSHPGQSPLWALCEIVGRRRRRWA